MRKHAIITITLILMALIAGCGGSSSTTAFVTGTVYTTTAMLTADEVTTRANFFSVPVNAASGGDITAYTFNTGNLSASATPTANGTWNISSPGTIVFVDPAGTQHRFTCIQKESSYWLISDEAHRISRFYFDLAAAQAYLDTIIISTNHTRLGGSVQGTVPAPLSTVTTIAGTAGSAGQTATTFYQPNGITTDGTNLYVADYRNNMIRKIVIADSTVSRLAGNGSGYAGYADGAGDTASFYLPSGITTDGTSLYVTDSGYHTIRKVDIATGNVVTLAGLAGNPGSTDGTGNAARFNTPSGITTDGTNLYVADLNNQTIRKIVISSGVVTTLAGVPGVAGLVDSFGQAGTGNSALFNNPAHLATDGTALYVTDSKNGIIRKILIDSGHVTTLAGIAGVLGAADGSGIGARFYQPAGITSDGTNLYVTDIHLNTVRKIEITSGKVTTLSGVSGQAGHVDSAEGIPTFNTPVGITTDGTSLYVVDSGNHLIRKIH